VLGVLIAVDALVFLLGEQGRALGFAGATVLPFAVLAGLSYLGEEQPRARAFALALLGVMAVLGVLTFLGSAIQLLQAAGDDQLSEAAEKQSAAIFLVSAHGMGLGALVLLRPVRRAISRLVPIDPDRFVHTVALALTVSLIVSAMAPLLVLGTPPQTALAARDSELAELSQPVYAQLYPLCWLIPVSVLAAGYGMRRTLPQALERLGVVWPTLRQVTAAVGVAVLLVIVATVLAGIIETLWTAQGWPRTDQKAFGQLMGQFLTPTGAIIVGVSAGVGEELVVRGVLQPRIGLIWSNLLFTALHAGQYHWDVLLVILILGLFFGLVRKHGNTTMSAIAHGLYDVLIILGAMQGGGLEQ
jgi:membrane protease YdiL (CAAX protease family)